MISNGAHRATGERFPGKIDLVSAMLGPGGGGVKTRYLGVIFIAAVLVPSVLLSVLSIRSAGREEAYVEKQLTTTLLAEVAHTASMVSEGVERLAGELHASVSVPPPNAVQAALVTWKKRNPLVGVPYLLSTEYKILWPRPDGNLGGAERLFLQENADFLSGRSTTPVYANIAIVHKEEVLGLAKAAAPLARAATQAAPSASAATEAPAPMQAEDAASSTESAPLQGQRAVDTFAQNAEVQKKIYEQARQQGEQVNARVTQPTSKALEAANDIGPTDRDLKAPTGSQTRPTTGPQTPPSGGAASAPVGQPSLYITTPRLLSQIASQGEYGIIPRFVGEKLTFLFWDRLSDGRIIGCELSRTEFRQRVAGILPATYSPVRILAVLDEKGEPLAVPAGAAGRDWRRPFVSQEIGEALPRWEAASYLTDPASIRNQARSTSAVIWILVVILFVSVAGGGTMVLSSLYGEMRLAQKKASFVANVSHELKTPLTSIGLFIDLLRRRRPPDAKKRDRYLALMAAETERLGRLINNVLDFSSQEKGRKKYAKRIVDLAQVADEVVEGQRVRLEGLGFAVRFICRESSERAFVDADPEAMKQVLINLLSNAEKYSTTQKEIEVEVECAGPHAAAHVRDRGIGVAEKDRERIFLEFVRVDDSLSAKVPGTGLGLTIARRIARDHGGDLVCEGREGAGSDFILTLPRRSGDEAKDPGSRG